MKLRGSLYWLARILGDLEALFSLNPTKVAKRAKNKIVGRNLLWRFFK